MLLKDKIVEKILANRVTLLVGDTDYALQGNTAIWTKAKAVATEAGASLQSGLVKGKSMSKLFSHLPVKFPPVLFLLMRLVLLSATTDISRYLDYFKDLGRDEQVEVLAIPSSLQQTLFQRKVSYFEQVIDLLGKKSHNLMDSYSCGPHPSCSDAEINMCKLN